MVSNSPLFDEVFMDFHNWYKYHTSNSEEKSVIVTSGNWDIGNIFVEQCNLFPSTIQIPKYMHSWINIKKVNTFTYNTIILKYNYYYYLLLNYYLLLF